MFVFDLLHVDGADLLDLPTSDRVATLDAIVAKDHRVDRLTTSDPDAAAAFLATTLAPAAKG